MVKFSKIHYEAIAKVIRGDYGQYLSDYPPTEEVDIAEVFSKMLAEDNERFSREKFLEACGLRP